MIFKISRFKIIYFFMHFNSVLVYTIVMKRYVTYPDWVEKFRSPGHTIKKTKQGLEIYQVSLDADEHYWKTAADNLPWVCVRDGNGVYSTNVAVYNVRQAPSIFLINRNNELKLRGEDIKDLEAAVKSLL